MNERQIAELDAIRQNDSAGLLRARAVVEAAKSPKSALHEHFTWDDTKAAEERRLDQARSLIRLAVTILPAPSDPHHVVKVRAYISLPSDRVNGGGYRPIVDVISDEQRTREAIGEYRRAVSALRAQFYAFAQFRPAIDRMMRDADDLQAAADKASRNKAGRRPKPKAPPPRRAARGQSERTAHK